MAENDIIFNVGLEADTSKITQQIRNLRVPAIKIPTVVEKSSARERIISAKSGAHTKDVEYLSNLIIRESLATGSTPTQSYNRIMGSKAGMAPFNQQLGTQAVTLATQQINSIKTQQREESLATRIAEKKAREESLLSQIEQTDNVSKLPALTKKQLLAMGRGIQNIPISQQTEPQKKILAVANELIDATNNSAKTGAKLIRALANIGKLTVAAELIKSGINVATRLAGIGFNQAANPAYNQGYTNWLTKVGLTKEQATQAQSEIITFRRRMQMGQVSPEEIRTYSQFAPSVYNALLSNAPFEQKVMQIRRALRTTSAEDRAQLMQYSNIASLLMNTLAYSDIDVMGGYETAMKTGAAQQARVAGDLKSLRQQRAVEQLAERGQADFKNTLSLAMIGAGLGLGLGTILAPVTAGGSLAAGVGLATALGFGGGVAGGLTGLGIDTAQNAGVNLFDYNKVVPVQDVSQREITINNTFQVDSEHVYNQTTHHLISNAETGVM